MEEVNMTAEEVHTFTKALQNETFRKMLHEYAQEISDPENRKMYEEEIKRLEQERGNSIEFVHPKPFRAIKTSADGHQKCFINICSNEKVGKPESKCGVSDAGLRGQHWSLPYSLHPGRQDTDGKGNKIVIYDVVFHPDTLYIAGKNKRFMDMVDNTAIHGIQKAFKVTIDVNNVKTMKTKYKGIPQPCVIRKPIPAFKARESSEQPDPLAFPYPDQKSSKQQTNTEDLLATKHKSDADIPIQSMKVKAATTPNHTLKYRSFIDLQDFRCSRDSAQSPRPKEIVVTIDLPLLKSVSDTNLEVQDKILLLESKNPAYRLELQLAYPVDENKGDAKFNKEKRQLTVTLPVLPYHPALSDCNFQSGTEGETEETLNRDEEGEKIEEEVPDEEETNRKQLQENTDAICESAGRDSAVKIQQQDNEEEVREVMMQNHSRPAVVVVCDTAAEEKDCAVTGSQCHASVSSPRRETSAIVSNEVEATASTEKLLTSVSVQQACDIQEEINPTCSFKFEVQEKHEERQETEHGNLQAPLTANLLEDDHDIPEAGVTSHQAPAPHEKSQPTRGQSDKQSIEPSEECHQGRRNKDCQPMGCDLEPAGCDLVPALCDCKRPECDRDPRENDHKPPECDPEMPECDRDLPESDHEPPECDPEPPESDHKPPECDPDPPECDPDPPDSNHEPPESNHEPPESNHEPPECDPEPPECDTEPPESDHKPPDCDPKTPECDPEPALCDHKPSTVSLREVDEDGNETVITDHSTSAELLFHNSLMFELD